MQLREIIGVFSHSIGADRRALVQSSLGCLGLALILGQLAWWLIAGATTGGIEHMITPEVGHAPLTGHRSSGEVEFRWGLMAGGVVCALFGSLFLLVSIWTMVLAIFRRSGPTSTL